jgi:membrane protein implicated in regulation of membrane protease activity
MIPARYGEWVFVGLMTVFMSLAVSGAMTLWSGFQGPFVAAWARSFLRAYVVVVPSVLVAAPLARRLTGMMVESPPEIDPTTRRR